MDNTRPRKTFNFLLFVLTLSAGIIWGPTGEVFLQNVLPGVNGIPVVGAYYTALFAFTILACLVSELFVPSLVEPRFFNNCTKDALKFSIPISLAIMFSIACFLQFVYSLDINTKIKVTPKIIAETEETKTTQEMQVEDFYFVIDDSGSLQTNDPKNIRIKVLNKLIEKMPEDKRISLVSFGGRDYARILQELTKANDQGKKEFQENVSRFDSSGPTTDILTALGLNKKLLDTKTDRTAMVVLITDGENTDKGPNAPTSEKVVEMYKDADIPLYSIFLGSASAFSISFLENISIPTGGKVILVENMDDFEKELTRVVTTKQIVKKNSKRPSTSRKVNVEFNRNLLTKREGKYENAFIYRVLHIPLPVARIIFITLLGILMGLLISYVFNYSPLILPLCTGGVLSGLMAGFILENYLQNAADPGFIRSLHDVILSAMLWIVALGISFIFNKISNMRPLEWLVANGFAARQNTITTHNGAETKNATDKDGYESKTGKSTL
jgi:Mg-chelatase subunit ChlD